MTSIINGSLIKSYQTTLLNYVSSRGAARKGKRIERARLARLNASKRRMSEGQNSKKKKDQRRSVKIDRDQMRFQTERVRDMTAAPLPVDDVYFFDKFKKPRYNLDDIIDFHRQAAHPDFFNEPDALIVATVELNIKMKVKKKKYIERIDSTVCYPNIYEHYVRPRRIVALCKKEEDQDAARNEGAIVAGAADVANLIKTNQLTYRDFDHIVCHDDFLQEFAAVKGMKNQAFFPNIQRGNYGDNIVDLVRYFKNGVDYKLRKLDDEPASGWIDCHFGRLNMTNEQLRQNLICLFNSINRFKPLNLADDKQFFERTLISTSASPETFLLKFWELIDDYQDPDTSGKEDEEERVGSVATQSLQ